MADLDRRRFVQLGGLAAAGIGAGRANAFAQVRRWAPGATSTIGASG